MITCLNCKSTFGEVVQQQKSITVPIPDQENSLTLERLLYFRFFCDVREPDLRTSCSKGCTDRVHETTILGQHQNYLLLTHPGIPPQQISVKHPSRYLLLCI